MTQARLYFEAADEARARLAAGVAEVERQLAGASPPADDGLRQSWAALVKLLDLTPPGQTRVCPHCEAPSMRAATRCGTCWSRLDPLPGDPAQPPVAGSASGF